MYIGTRTERYGLLIEGLEEHGWVEGQNLVIERYSAEGNEDLLPALAQAVVNSEPDLIFSLSGRMLDATMAATDSIPVVSVIGQRMLERHVESLAQPGGNLTGPATSAGTGIRAKRLQLLHEVVPTMTRVAYLSTRHGWESRHEKNSGLRALLEFADQLGITVVLWLFDNPVDADTFHRLFASSAEVDGLFVHGANALEDELKATVVSLAKDAGLPSMLTGRRQYVDFGGLMYYGQDIPSQYHRAAWYVDQILRGADPGELPIEQPTKYDFIINLNTAREIGITFPINILYRATKAIE